MGESDKNEIYISPAPHISTPARTWHVMLVVIVLLLPLAGYGIYLFGLPAAITIAVSVCGAVAFESLFRALTKQENRIKDLSAIVTGLMLAMVLPPTTPWWVTLLGSVFSVIVAKEFFGGLGANVFNPALAGRAFLLMSFSQPLTTWIMPLSQDVISTATPLEYIKMGDGISKLASRMDWATDGEAYWNLLIGKTAGCIGESNSLLIIIAFIILVLTRVIDWRAPVAMIVTSIILSLAFSMNPIVQVLTGGLLFGAVFMTTDYATTPVTQGGRIIFGIGAGLITMLIRKFGSYPEGVMFSILIMNIFSGYLNNILPRKYGYSLKKKEGK